MLFNSGGVLFHEYSSLSKIFVFPYKLLLSEWLEKMDFWTNSSKKELIYIIFTKVAKQEDRVYEKLIPEVVESTTSFYKITSKTQIIERDTFQPKKIIKTVD